MSKVLIAYTPVLGMGKGAPGAAAHRETQDGPPEPIFVKYLLRPVAHGYLNRTRRDLDSYTPAEKLA